VCRGWSPLLRVFVRSRRRWRRSLLASLKAARQSAAASEKPPATSEGVCQPPTTKKTTTASIQRTAVASPLESRLLATPLLFFRLEAPGRRRACGKAASAPDLRAAGMDETPLVARVRDAVRRVAVDEFVRDCPLEDRVEHSQVAADGRRCLLREPLGDVGGDVRVSDRREPHRAEGWDQSGLGTPPRSGARAFTTQGLCYRLRPVLAGARSG